MVKLKSILTGCLILASFLSTAQVAPEIRSLSMEEPSSIKTDEDILTGAEQIDGLQEQLEGKSIGIIANHTSLIEGAHLVDYMVELGLNVQLIFTPEHGFRGDADAGEQVNSGKDKKTGIKIVSLYGANKKPKLSDLLEVDIVLYDLQDVGVRFYTYISTLYYAMEACAEADLPLIVLDRPNPNGFYVDGPMLQEGFESFVGVVKIPVVYGMTAGEYAMMLNGENMLRENEQCKLQVVACKGYSHKDKYQLPVKPSPNLPTMESVYLYPSLCFFEGTVVSVGRGTDKPFEQYGHPSFFSKYSFTPESVIGARTPKLEGEKCYGEILTNQANKMDSLNLNWIIDAYSQYKEQEQPFFLENNFVNLLYGSDQLQNGVKAGMKASEIRKTWQEDLNAFKAIRAKYLLYPDF